MIFHVQYETGRMIRRATMQAETSAEVYRNFYKTHPDCTRINSVRTDAPYLTGGNEKPMPYVRIQL